MLLSAWLDGWNRCTYRLERYFEQYRHPQQILFRCTKSHSASLIDAMLRRARILYAVPNIALPYQSKKNGN